MARKQEKCIALLVAVTALAAGVGNASRVPGTVGVAFVPSTLRCEANQSPSRGWHAQQQQQQSSLRTRCGWGWACPLRKASSRQQGPTPHVLRPNSGERSSHLKLSASSGLQDPVGYASPAAAAAAGLSPDDSALTRQAAADRREWYGLEGRHRAQRGNAGKGSGEIYMQGRGSGGGSRGEVRRAHEAHHGTAATTAVVVEEDVAVDTDIYLPGGRGAGLRPGVDPKAVKTPVLWSKPVASKLRRLNGRFKVLLAGREDLEEAGALCIKVFFGDPDSPWKAAQLRQLTGEQRQDLESRCNRKESVMFKAVDTRRNDAMVGFIEVSETSGSKYGMGSGVPLADTRPVVSNLAVDRRARRAGVGTALMDACEDMVKTWNFDEIILQVEEDNEEALAFYSRMGFSSLFVDRSARRYDTSGFLLQNVRTSKLTMRKVVKSDVEASRSPPDSVGDHLAHLLGFLAKPFVARPPPSSRNRARSASVKNLFGPPGGGGGGGRGGGVKHPDSRTEGGPTQEVPPVRLHRTRR